MWRWSIRVDVTGGPEDGAEETEGRDASAASSRPEGGQARERPALDPSIEEAVRTFKARTGVETLYVFGSHVEGTADEHSDLDVLIIDPRFEGLRFFERPVELYDDWPSRIPVDLLCFTPDEVEELRDRPSIVQEALERGVAVA